MESKMKKERHEKIVEIIRNNDIETQEDLIVKLKEAGFDTTQATVSRDIRELKLTKATDSHGKYKYVFASNENEASGDVYLQTLSRSIRRAAQSMNMVVVHTYSGMAQACAAGIDAHDSDIILGCVAGDDTILIVLKDEDQARSYYSKISTLIK